MKDRKDLGELMDEGVDRVRQNLEEGVDRVRQNVEESREKVEAMAEDAIARGEEAWKDVVKLVHKHPGKAVGISVLAGALLGMLLSRRRD